MRRYASFDSFEGEEWPDLKWLERYFLAPPGQQWFYDQRRGTDCAQFSVMGLSGTDHLKSMEGRIDIDLDLMGNPGLGVFLMYRQFGPGRRQTAYSKGNMRRLGEWVPNAYEDLIPVALFIPFERAWPAVKEFIETDGGLSRSIEWISSGDLPPGTWPDVVPDQYPGRPAL